MGLTSGLYSGISGLSSHGEKMSVISNNLANTNTVGFKGARMHFEDVMSQDVNTAAGVGQVGRGVRVAAIYTSYSQGSYEATQEATDLAIGGEGFFIVSPRGEEQEYFTRAGNFRFNKEGFLVDPHGYVLQGWEVEQKGSEVASTESTSDSTGPRIVGVPKDIRLDNFQSPPNATSKMTMISNLDPSKASRTNWTGAGANPYLSLWNAWDATNDKPLPEGNYSYSSTMKVFDEIGTAHNMTTYFDQVTLSNAGGDTVWEYCVTVDPSEEKRMLSDGAGNMYDMKDSSAAGMLMTGTMTFRNGQLVSQTAFTLQGISSGGAGGMDSWKPAQFSTEGYPLVTPNFLGKSDASYSTATNAKPIEIDFGLRNTNLAANAVGITGWADSTPPVLSAADMSTNITNTGQMPQFAGAELSAMTTQSYDTGGSATLFKDQDGYTAGSLQNLTVDRDGVLIGTYSNGQVVDLYALTLATFSNKWGLRRNGGNIFSETKDSGPALTGQANANGRGTVNSNSLEMSNVDMATEFVNMITTQRGFQANTKVITSTDSMLGEVIAMKR
ncbi:MAG: flagellar hook protein FlgE [Desulfovibrio sp.]